VADVHVISVTSKSVTVSWSSLDCDQRNGPTVGYSCELTQQHSLETTHGVETTHGDGVIVELTNETQFQHSDLKPFTHYMFTVSFVNADFDGPKTVVNFTTDEGGLLHVVF